MTALKQRSGSAPKMALKQRSDSGPKTAMVLAAGLGTRMRPLTDDRPKALVEVAGRALIDHTLDRLAEAGVETAVVNVHHFADMVQAHLARRSDLRILISDERAGLLDSGGGIAHARPLLGEGPIFVANIDNVWIEGARPALRALADLWDPARMDVAILLAPRDRSTGFERPEGFLRDAEGRLTHSNCPDPLPPFNNIGFQILDPAILDGRGDGAFSVVPLWKDLSARGRLFGAVMDGFDMHVSDPAARDAAEARLGTRP
jgi:MurNAc alpha-1-phosphate uridylyltransferase